MSEREEATNICIASIPTSNLYVDSAPTIVINPTVPVAYADLFASIQQPTWDNAIKVDVDWGETPTLKVDWKDYTKEDGVKESPEEGKSCIKKQWIVQMNGEELNVDLQDVNFDCLGNSISFKIRCWDNSEAYDLITPTFVQMFKNKGYVEDTSLTLIKLDKNEKEVYRLNYTKLCLNALTNAFNCGYSSGELSAQFMSADLDVVMPGERR